MGSEMCIRDRYNCIASSPTISRGDCTQEKRNTGFSRRPSRHSNVLLARYYVFQLLTVLSPVIICSNRFVLKWFSHEIFSKFFSYSAQPAHMRTPLYNGEQNHTKKPHGCRLLPCSHVIICPIWCDFSGRCPRTPRPPRCHRGRTSRGWREPQPQRRPRG